jgi:hypothetical protein
MGREGTLAMTDRTENASAQAERKSDASPNQKAPRRPSYDRVIQDIDKWVTSSGLQKPT